MRAEPDHKVMAWLDEQRADELWLTAINTAELLFGVARLPNGARKLQLGDALACTLDEDFNGKILPFDAAVAVAFANLAVIREAKGRLGSIADTQIAAICLHHRASLATRNVRHFEDMGLHLIDPWA